MNLPSSPTTARRMARAWVINSYSGYKSLELVSVPVQEPGEGELPRFDFPACVGIEAAGIVEAIGEGVEGVIIGNRYCTLPHFYYDRGASRESLIIDARYITLAPEGRPAVERKGAAHVIVTDGSGAPIADQLLEITQGKGVDAAFDPIGAGLMDKYSPALAKDSRIYFYGTLDTKCPDLPLLDMFQKNVTFQPCSVFNYVENPAMKEHGVAFVNRHLAEGMIKPCIGRVFPMEQYKEAWDYLSGVRSSHGKVVIDVRR
ncbi:quinone oxidoreductase [Fusarium albosuccineum]|uniref:Quinone oxidoreductase n=1 Tax=Fusarium albosuccineum TaxID=1237068 RepID=A0A8H4LE99_9HYPO|nr:quinone oxidoreductase [Fusarium albosuccineum]